MRGPREPLQWRALLLQWRTVLLVQCILGLALISGAGLLYLRLQSGPPAEGRPASTPGREGHRPHLETPCRASPARCAGPQEVYIVLQPELAIREPAIRPWMLRAGPLTAVALALRQRMPAGDARCTQEVIVGQVMRVQYEGPAVRPCWLALDAAPCSWHTALRPCAGQ